MDKITFSGTLGHVITLYNEYWKQGYRVSYTYDVIDWPYFWRRRWIVEMVRRTVGVYIDGKLIGVATPADVTVAGNTEYTFEFQGLVQFGEPPSILKPLEQQLSEAVEAENYELAARLRDQIT